jgi:hypothetical protein
MAILILKMLEPFLVTLYVPRLCSHTSVLDLQELKKPKHKVPSSRAKLVIYLENGYIKSLYFLTPRY